MRGTPNIRPLAGKGDGIIPAYAGNTGSGQFTVGGDGDHPRVCGEHHWASLKFVGNLGSSPRMRGTLAIPFLRFVIHGIIPAYAGNT